MLPLRPPEPLSSELPTMDALINFLNRLPWYAWMGIVAIAASTVTQLVRMSHRHEERMALIKQGRDPESVSDGSTGPG